MKWEKLENYENSGQNNCKDCRVGLKHKSIAVYSSGFQTSFSQNLHPRKFLSFNINITLCTNIFVTVHDKLTGNRHHTNLE